MIAALLILGLLAAVGWFHAWCADDKIVTLVRSEFALANENAALRDELARSRPIGLTPVYDAIVIDLFDRDLDRLDEQSETWGPA